MIAKLFGIIHENEFKSGTALVDVSGVFYQIWITRDDLMSCIGQKKSIYIEYISSEKSVDLFGFLEVNSKKLFIHLTKISGLGPKFAMAILDSIGVDNAMKAIQMKNQSVFQAVSGIGAKLSLRLVNELKYEKLIQDINISTTVYNNKLPDQVTTGDQYQGNINIFNEACLTLEALGYKKSYFMKQLTMLFHQNEYSIAQDIIKDFLKTQSK